MEASLLPTSLAHLRTDLRQPIAQLAPADHLSPIPDNVSFEQAAPILCAGVTTYAAIKHTEAKPGEFLTIIGGTDE